jgi:hypothetical protein
MEQAASPQPGPACRNCDGSGCHRCQTKKKCATCRNSLRVGLFGEGESICHTCQQRKKYKKSALNDAVQEISLPTSEEDVGLDEYMTANADEINKVVGEAVEKHRLEPG